MMHFWTVSLNFSAHLADLPFTGMFRQEKLHGTCSLV
jgi:hypothetical protein